MRKKSSTIVEFRIPIWNTIVFGEIKKRPACASRFCSGRYRTRICDLYHVKVALVEKVAILSEKRQLLPKDC